MSAPRGQGKPRLSVELFYTFGGIVLLTAALPLLLLIGFSGLALLFGWTVDDGQAVAGMKNALVLTEVLLAVGVPLIVAGHVMTLHPPAQHKGGTDTDEVQIPPKVN